MFSGMSLGDFDSCFNINRKIIEVILKGNRKRERIRGKLLQ